MKVVYVEWVDSVSKGGRVWHGKDEFQKPASMKCRSIGFVVAEDKDSITIAGHDADGCEAVSGDMQIPKKAITKRRAIAIKK